MADRAGAPRRSPSARRAAAAWRPTAPALIGYYRDRIAELRAFVVAHDVVTVPDWLGAMRSSRRRSSCSRSRRARRCARRGSSQVDHRLLLHHAADVARRAAARLDMNQDFDRDRICRRRRTRRCPVISCSCRSPGAIRISCARSRTARVFAEGWAFYGEEMFVRLGLYGDDLDGRLFTARWERVRGARAIVDPKLARGEWTVEQAIDFYARNRASRAPPPKLPSPASRSDPGYVISYTVGRLQLEDAARRVHARMAEHGSLHDFHDRLLSYGTAPFAFSAPNCSPTSASRRASPRRRALLSAECRDDGVGAVRRLSAQRMAGDSGHEGIPINWRLQVLWEPPDKASGLPPTRPLHTTHYALAMETTDPEDWRIRCARRIAELDQDITRIEAERLAKDVYAFERTRAMSPEEAAEFVAIEMSRPDRAPFERRSAAR